MPHIVSMTTWTPTELARWKASFTSERPLQEECGVGSVSTALPRVRFFWSTEAVERAPSVVDDGIVILLSGRKVGTIGQRQLVYDADHYLVVSASVPYEYAAQASPTEPLTGVFVELDPTELKSLVGALRAEGEPEREGTPGVEAAPLDEAMRDVVRRLLNGLLDPRDAAILGPSLVRELVYRALRGPGGGGLWALTRVDTQQARIAGLLLEIKQDLAARRSVDDLARRVSMSESTFHRAFRGLTGETPIQYIKKLRLHRARSLIALDGLAVGEAAVRVGYESPTQFSREFRRLFGVAPSVVRQPPTSMEMS